MNNVVLEEWRDIEGYESLYKVSNLGRVKRLCYRGKNAEFDYGKPRVLRQKTTAKGYKSLQLCKNNEPIDFQVHRLVAEGFIDKPSNLEANQVNHKDGCKTNNNAKNLEWVTASENMRHAYEKNLIEPTRHWEGKRGQKHPSSKRVVVLDKQGDFIKEFESILLCRDWLRETVNPKASDSHIVSCCKGKRNYHCGYKYKYRSDYRE